jgi:long-subunit acyl-CoA synthetase (AMP-forming)
MRAGKPKRPLASRCRLVRSKRSGEICVAGPLLAGGYWNLPEETAATFRDGWLHTGDVAREDEDGEITLQARG